MSAVLVSKEKNQAVFTCEIPAEDFNNAIEESYKKNRSKFSLKGFRKGKVPRKM
ncbi:MAG: trigger factor family protein, partial [Finegoldia magna]|nr:trigger factor family protein [Finegoldia magna]MDU5998104.1 trigger factor family protein [Finegoldia magna]